MSSGNGREGAGKLKSGASDGADNDEVVIAAAADDAPEDAADDGGSVGGTADGGRMRTPGSERSA